MDQDVCHFFDYSNEPPAKRRRVAKDDGLGSSLLLRKQTYNQLWHRTQKHVESAIDKVHSGSIERVQGFLESQELFQTTSKIPAVFIVTGPSSISHRHLFEHIRGSTEHPQKSIFVSLAPADGVNLKTLLKLLIKRAVNPVDVIDGFEDDQVESHGHAKLLNYDLQIIYDRIKGRGRGPIIVAFQDSEGFDTSVLADALKLFQSWSDRIAFAVLFGISTSLETFQERLPSLAARCLAGKSFDMSRSEDVLDVAFQYTFDEDCGLQLGPGLTRMILLRHREQLVGVESYLNWIKYAYMSHFFGNPLSVFLATSVKFETISKHHYEAVRNLPSFQTFIENLTERGEPELARKLLSSDQDLFHQIRKGMAAGREALGRSLGATKVVQILQSASTKPVSSFPSLYEKALAGELQTSSPSIRELLLFTKRITSDVLLQTIEQIADVLIGLPPNDEGVSPDEFRDLQDRLSSIVKRAERGAPLRTKDDVVHGTFKTATVGRKTKINKAASGNEEQQDEYTQLVEAFHNLLEEFFDHTITSYRDIFLHEILVYDNKSPHRDVFAPRPRYAIERALSSPHDYLGCDCCRVSTEGHLWTQPATAILYQLYLESGALINAFDLWSAFHAVMEEHLEDEKLAMALFFRSLAELKQMGFIKQSRKKLDHFAKLAWRGL